MMSKVSPFFINSSGTFETAPQFLNESIPTNLKDVRGSVPLWHINANEGTQELSENGRKCLSKGIRSSGKGGLPVEIGEVVGDTLCQARLKKCKCGRQIVGHLVQV